MRKNTFLKTVAEKYYNHYYKSFIQVSFVFPNKRSGTFFLKYLKNISEGNLLTPEIFTITDLAEYVSGTPVDNFIGLLFKLFDCYRDLVGENADFEKFRGFGETALNDFSEIDMHLVNQEMIFKNIKDLNKLKTNFITPNISKVQSTYFNYPDAEIALDNIEKFWKEFPEIEEIERLLEESDGIIEDKKLRVKFVQLWAILGPLYKKFKAKLATEGVNTAGGCYRLAAEILSEEELPEKLRNRKFVFVGFNALTASEEKIFSSLKSRKIIIDGQEEPAADFIWDNKNKFFEDRDNQAGKYVAINAGKDNFPFPSWWNEGGDGCESEFPEEIKVISVPSNVMQIKLIKSELDGLIRHLDRGDKDDIKAIRTAKVAVVLPDESYLMPLLNSLPETKFSVNLTMGYALKNTPIATFMSLLKKFQFRKRPDDRVGCYYLLDELKKFLGHPYCQLLFGSDKIGMLIQAWNKSKKMVVSYEALRLWDERASVVFRPLSERSTVEDMKSYLREVLQLLRSVFEKEKQTAKVAIELLMIQKVLESLCQFESSLKEYDVKMNFFSFLSVFDRLLSAISISFEGEPVEGLQIMGLLETRNLNFDYVFIPGLNDKILPRSGSTRTFIPNVVRIAYGMPPANFKENLFAYYFYRLVGSAKQAILSYDSRAVDNPKGGVSRYVLQLKHLFPDLNLKEYDSKFILEEKKEKDFEFEKDAEVLELLAEFKGENSTRHLSASSLQKYCKCPVAFYYYIKRIKVEKEEIETLDPITQGNVIHDVIMSLYMPDTYEEKKLFPTPHIITEDKIRDLLEDEERIEKEMIKAINFRHYSIKKSDPEIETNEVSGSAAFIMPNLISQVKKILRYDLKLSPFEIFGCEVEKDVPFEVNDKLTVKFRMVIDRLDKIEDKDENIGRAKNPTFGMKMLRVVDYKTGTAHIQAQSPDDVFNGNYASSNMLQIFLYSYLLRLIDDDEKKKLHLSGLPLRAEIYEVPKLGLQQTALLPKIGGERISILGDDLFDWFIPELKKKIEEIFDPTVPFKPTDSKKDCDMCDFKMLCNAMRYKT